MVIILVRYGEIALKSSPVRKRFEHILVRNIRLALDSEGISSRIRKDPGRLFLETSAGASRTLKKVFGIVSFSRCLTCDSEIEEIKKTALQIAKGKRFTTFALKTSRVGSQPFNSQKINEEVGDFVRRTLKKKVDLSHPDLTIFIEVRDKKTYLYTEKIPGLGGLPLGTQRSLPALIENKNDVLAAWLFMRRGCEVIPVFKGEIGLKTLESWAFKKMEFLTFKEFEKNAKNFYGVVSTNPKSRQFKKKYHLPVYNPLLGMGETEIKKWMKIIEKT